MKRKKRQKKRKARSTRTKRCTCRHFAHGGFECRCRSLPLPDAQPMTANHTLRRVTAHALTRARVALACPLAWLHQGGQGCFNDHIYMSSSNRSAKVWKPLRGFPPPECRSISDRPRNDCVEAQPISASGNAAITMLAAWVTRVFGVASIPHCACKRNIFFTNRPKGENR